MKKKRTLAILSCCFCLVTITLLPRHIHAAAQFIGVVLENSLGGKPLGGAQISAIGANTTTSGSQSGAFTLEFPRRNPGETIFLAVSREGYVVVNDIQLEQTLRSLPETKVFRVILSNPKIRYQCALAYYRLAGHAVIDKKHEAEVRKLDAQSADKGTIARLKAELETARNAVDSIAQQAAKGFDKSGSELYRQAMRYFLDGDIDQALKTLNEQRLFDHLRKNQELKAKAEQEEEQILQALYLRSDILTTQFKFHEAREVLIKAVSAAPDNYRPRFKLAVFCQKQCDYSGARLHYEFLLMHPQVTGSKSIYAATLNNIANLHSDENRMDQALEAYNEALKISRQLAEQNPAVYKPDLAMTLNNIAILHRYENRMDQALEAYNEALKIYRQLAEQNPAVYKPDLASTLANMAIYYLREDNNKKGLVTAKEALKIYTEILPKSPAQYQPKIDWVKRIISAL